MIDIQNGPSDVNHDSRCDGIKREYIIIILKPRERNIIIIIETPYCGVLFWVCVFFIHFYFLFLFSSFPSTRSIKHNKLIK